MTGGGFSAKDFRTWNATVLGAVSVAVLGAEAETTGARKRAVNASVKAVAAYLAKRSAREEVEAAVLDLLT